MTPNEIENRFNDCFQECKRHARTAKLIMPIAHGYWIIGFESLAGYFIAIEGSSSPDQVAAALALRQVEFEARELYTQRANIAHMETAGGVQ